MRNIGRIVRTILLFVLSIIAIAATAQQAPAQRALELFNQKKYSEVIAYCDSELGKDPKNGALFNTRGAARYMLGDYAKSIPDFDASIANGNKTDVVYANRGRAYKKLGDLTKAIEDFSTAIQVKPDAAGNYYERASAHYLAGKYQASLDDASSALEKDPKHMLSYNQRALAKGALGDNRGAVKDYDEAIKLAPNDGVLYANRSSAYRRLDDGKNAVADAEKAISLGHKTASAYNTRALAKMSANDYKGAAEDLEIVLKLEPDQAIYVANKGRCYYYLEDYAAASREFERAINMDPKSSAAFRYRAEMYEKQGKTDLARADAIAALQLSPNDVAVKNVAARLAPDTKATTTESSETVGLAPAPFGYTNTSSDVFVSKDWNDAKKDPIAAVLWKPVNPLTLTPPKADPVSIPPVLEFGNMPMDLYNWAVTTAKEGMRVVMGPMTQEQTVLYEAKWAPYYDAPTPEVLTYLNNINPLIGQFISARSGYVRAAQEVGKALQEAGLLSEAAKDAEASVAVEAAKYYRTFMDGYQASMHAAVVAIDQLGPMPNPYEARRRRAKRLQDELKRLTPTSAGATAKPAAGSYFVLSKIEPNVAQPTDPKVKMSCAEGFVSMSVVGKPWYVEKGTMNMSATASWTPLPRLISRADGVKALVDIQVTCALSFEGVTDAEINGFGLKDNFGPVLHVGFGSLPTDGVSKLIKATGNRPRDKAQVDIRRVLDETYYYGGRTETEASFFVTVQTGAGNAIYRYIYKMVRLTADQAAEIDSKAKAELAELEKARGAAEAKGKENEAVTARLQYLMESRRMFEVERDRVKAEMANAPYDSRKELLKRMMYADAQAQASNDAVTYATTGQWVRTRTLYDDYDFNRMLEIGREESARLALPLKAVKMAEAQIQLAPESMREDLRDRLKKGLTDEMIRGRDGDGVRALARSIGDSVQAYWMKESGDQSFKATLYTVAEEGTKIGAGVIICGAGGVYVAGLGAEGVTLWAADTLFGAAYGGVSGYVEGGPDEACKKSLEWAGLVGFAASTAIDAYGQTGSATSAVTATARALALAKTFQYAATYVGKFFAKPSVQEQFAMAKFKQEMEWGQALIQRAQRAETAMAEATSKKLTGKALQQAERELAEATAAVNGSWHAKVLLKYGGDEATGKAFIKNVERLYEEVQPQFIQQLKAMGYDTSNLNFESIRNASSAGSVGLDLDLRLIETPGMVIKKGGKPVSLATFGDDAQKAYNKAYFAQTGYSAPQSLVNVTTTAHREAFTQRMIQAEIPFSSLSAVDRQRAADVLIAKTAGVELEGFTKAAEASRAIEKELRLRLIPDLQAQAAKAAAKGDAAGAKKLQESVEFWKQIHGRTQDISSGETDPMKIWRNMQELKNLSGGKDVFELANVLSAYWQSLSKWR